MRNKNRAYGCCNTAFEKTFQKTVVYETFRYYLNSEKNLLGMIYVINK